VHLPNGESVETTYLLVGGFDLLAVNLLEFGQEWRFAFAKNSDLPRTTSSKYTPEQREFFACDFGKNNLAASATVL
jgi:hypothetical protein